MLLLRMCFAFSMKIFIMGQREYVIHQTPIKELIGIRLIDNLW